MTTLKLKSELATIVAERILEAQYHNNTIIDLTDLDLASKSPFYTACKALKVDRKQFIVKWPKSLLKHLSDYNKQRRQALLEDGSITTTKKKKVVSRQMTQQEQQTFLTPNRELSYNRLLKQNKKLQEDLKELSSDYERLIDEHNQSRSRIRELEVTRRNLETKLHHAHIKIRELEEALLKRDDESLVKEDIYDKAEFLCPSCGKSIAKKYRTVITSGHILLNCPHCKAMHAVENDDLEIVIIKKKGK